MRKRGLLSVSIVLLLTVSILGVLLTSNNPTILPILPSNYVNPSAKSYIGTGGPLSALLYITNSTDSTPNATNTDNNIYIPCPNGWKIVWANITLSNINAPNYTVQTNNSQRNYSLGIEDTERGMSFNLTNNAYLNDISVLIEKITIGETSLILNIYNSTWVSGKPKPDKTITSSMLIDLPSSGGIGSWIWANKTLSTPLLLNISRTENNTFFISLKRAASGYIMNWGAVSYGNQGYAYDFSSSSYLDLDFILKANVSASTSPAENALPSEIGLTINGSPVSDISKGNGEWINSTASPDSSGYIFYDANSTWMDTVSFSYIWNVTYGKDTTANTNFVVSYNSDAFWNVTVDATDAFPLTIDGVNHINVTGIPSDWSGVSSKAYNQTGTTWISLDSYPPSTISFLASNGTWIVNCTAPNYISNIGFDVGGEMVENATLYDNLNINVTFNTTLRSNVSGTATLNIYDFSIPQILNHTEEKQVIQAIKTSFIWDVDTNATSTGAYNVTVSFQDGFVVGYNETLLDIVALTNTSLTVTSFPSSVEYPGPVPITVYYNRTDNGQGLTGANINAYFTNSTPLAVTGLISHGNGSYSFNLDFTTDFDIHNVYFNASGLRLFESSISSSISINYTRVLVSIQLNTPSSVVLGTSLVASAHLRFTTNTSNFVGATVNFNFSLRFSNGSITIIQRNGITNDQGLGEGSILVPINTVNLNVTAFYMGTSTVFGAGSSVNSVGLTSGPPGPDTGLVSLMFLMMTQQSQNFMLYLLLGVVIGSVVVVAAAADRVRRRRAVPIKALSSLENIIVDHIATGVTLWAFDFFRMEQDVALVSGFMSAVKSFMAEMQKGGLRKLETEFGTFIREDGNLITVTCITCGNTTAEERWIRQRLQSFLSIAEEQHAEELQRWRGDLTVFRESFPVILASVIDLDKTERLQRERVSQLEKDKERLQEELNRLGSQLESLKKQYESGEISKGEYDDKRGKIEPEYDRVQKQYIHDSLCLSRVPPALEAKKPTVEAAKEVEKIQERFLEIRIEIEKLRRKELKGTITSKDKKHRDELQKELMKLLEKLDKFKQK
ncbi:MAG: hypothetical protein ACUVXA_14175 [Candidatus Jordarchaeum sp.]|uniref:hypothetical protein n=1 Tax=Candidatus Jordarchaeum sp. TaxID=2823881 RepID=UPI00404B7EDA